MPSRQYQFWILLQQEMMEEVVAITGTLRHVQIICISLQSDHLHQHINNQFYKPDAHPVTRSTTTVVKAQKTANQAHHFPFSIILLRP